MSSLPRDLTSGGRLEELRWPDFSDLQADVAAFYERSRYEAVWSREGSITPQAIATIETLKQAASRGLDPEDYDASRWPARVAHPDLARFDLALTVSAMRYASDLHRGRWNPGIYHSRLDLRGERYDLPGLIQCLAHAPDENAVRSLLRETEPPFPVYQRTEAVLQRYLELARADTGEKLPAAKLPIEPGSSYAGVLRLAALLGAIGDLPAGIPVPEVYGGPLVDAVKRFQERHGLDADGRIGRGTLAALNTPLAGRVRQLQLTLERFRWLPHEFAGLPIVVNIPEFELRGLNESYAAEIQMKVVVGQAMRRETPVFTAEMTYVTFRPYWHVPPSITRAELIPKILHDSGYLAANGYEVVSADYEHVSSAAVDQDTVAKLRAGKLAIRQAPGPKNSLGLIAFLFPNEYGVYLHDTPAQELFSRSRRDFSHGCIRVERPLALAEWVFRDMPEWTEERIREAMHGTKTLRVDLKTPIPVLIVYATAVVMENGDTRFSDDLYGFDAQLDALASKGYPSARWNPTSGARGPHPHE